MVLAFADDVILVSENKKVLDNILDNLVELLEEVGLRLNLKKCEILVKSPLSSNCHDTEVRLGKYSIRRVKQIKYLGTTLTENLCRSKTISKRCRIAVRCS